MQPDRPAPSAQCPFGTNQEYHLNNFLCKDAPLDLLGSSLSDCVVSQTLLATALSSHKKVFV